MAASEAGRSSSTVPEPGAMSQVLRTVVPVTARRGAPDADGPNHEERLFVEHASTL